MKRYMQTHSGMKPFSTEVCDWQFSNMSTLKNHMQKHSGEKPFSCEVCKITFIRSSLKRNLNTNLLTVPGIIWPHCFWSEKIVKVLSGKHPDEKGYVTMRKIASVL